METTPTGRMYLAFVSSYIQGRYTMHNVDISQRPLGGVTIVSRLLHLFMSICSMEKTR